MIIFPIRCRRLCSVQTPGRCREADVAELRLVARVVGLLFVDSLAPEAGVEVGREDCRAAGVLWTTMAVGDVMVEDVMVGDVM